MQEIYFAAANSGSGFVSYYGEIFDPVRFGRTYLIKGGPGTGKSSLMRRAAEAAERRGLSVVRYACSSDPDSLDGIIVGENRFAMLDATAPHLKDPVLPGAADELIDLGRFWHRERLISAREEILSLNTRKKEAYVRAYLWLSGVQAAERNIRCLLAVCTDYPKLRRAVSRYLQGIPSGKGEEKPGLIDSVGMRGRVCIDTMQKKAVRTYVLRGTRGGGDIFLRELRTECSARKINFVYAPRADDPTALNGLYFPDAGVAFVDESCAVDSYGEDKSVNMERFLKADCLRKVRRELRHAARTRAMMEEGAAYAFSEIREAHFALENIYMDAMDFSALNAYGNALIERILSADCG